MIRLFEAFSGYGSQALALKLYNVNFEHVGISEINKNSIKAHKALHGNVKNYGDITKIDSKLLPYFDLFTYSFPCTDITGAGKQRGFEKGSGTSSSLLWECEKIIKEKNPKFLMLENVARLVSKRYKKDFDKWLEILNSYGYNNYWKVINSEFCDVPQRRKRVFVVSIRKDVDNGMFNFYDDKESTKTIKDILEQNVEEKYYLSQEMLKGYVQKNNFLGYVNQDTQASKVMDESTVFQTICAGTHGYANGYVKVKTNTKKGYQVAKPYDVIDLERPTSKTRRGRVGYGVCQTLTSSCNHAILENDFRLRKITPREGFRLMGVSEEDVDILLSLGFSDTVLYFLIGKSIVVQCMKFLKKLEAIDILNEDKPKGQLSLF